MVKKVYLAIGAILVLATIVLTFAFLANSVPKYDPSQNVINIVFRYGVGAKNELNTFEGTYTKDLVMDNTMTAKMILSQAELGEIQQRIVDMDFFTYPENFSANPHIAVTPQFDYYVKVQTNSTTKEVSWNTNSLIESNIQQNLSQFTTYITSLIEQKPEYKALPTANGAYQ